MSYLAPNSNIYLMENIPINSSYEDTIRFPFPINLTPANLATHRQNQFNNYFSRYVKYTFTEQYYQRADRGWLRICKRYEDVYTCNYLAFKNTSFEDRYFYAFIDEVRYINNVVCEIHYTIDVIQTWYFDIKWNNCFIDRAHSTTDEIGDNIVPEDFSNMGEYDYFDTGTQRVFERVGTVLASTVEFPDSTILEQPTFDAVEGAVRQNIYGGVQYYYFDNDRTGWRYPWLNTCIRQMTYGGKSDALVSMFMYPWELFNLSENSNNNYNDSDPNDLSFIRVLNPSAHISPFGNYVPFNKKLFTYPYVKIIATDENGQDGEYRPEQFKDSDGVTSNCVFKVQSSLTANPEIQIVPLNYEGLDVNFISKLTTNNFASCPYTIDSYLAWLAQTRVPRILSATNTISNALSGVVGGTNLVNNAEWVMEKAKNRENWHEYDIATRHKALAKNRISHAGIHSAIDAVEGVADVLLNSYRPPIAQGQQTNAMQTSIQRVGFRFYRCYLKEEFAKRVDNYFSHYGYAIKDFGLPKTYIEKRAKYAFIRTEGCNASGNIPNDDMTQINAIMDNGITFWDYSVYNNIKDYDLLARENTIVS